MTAADILDKQGETTLAREVRKFAGHLPTVLFDRENLTVDYVRQRQPATNKVPIGEVSVRRLHATRPLTPPFKSLLYI